MPRNRKTLSGANALITPPVANQEYGSGVAQQALAQAMPAPRATAGGPAIAAPSQPTNLAAAASSLRDQVGLLNPDTARPNEPVTHGLPSGPGGGPEVLTGMAQSPLGDTLNKLASLTGDPFFQQLAQDSGL